MIANDFLISLAVISIQFSNVFDQLNESYPRGFQMKTLIPKSEKL